MQRYIFNVPLTEQWTTRYTVWLELHACPLQICFHSHQIKLGNYSVRSDWWWVENGPCLVSIQKAEVMWHHSMSWVVGENRQDLFECVLCGERGGVEVRWLVRWQSKQQISPIKFAGRRAEGCNWYHCHQLIIEEIKWLLKLMSNLDFLSQSQDIHIPFNSLLEALRSDKNIMCEWLLSVGWILWDSKHLCSTFHITHVETHIVKLSSWLKSSTKQWEQRITLTRMQMKGRAPTCTERLRWPDFWNENQGH